MGIRLSSIADRVVRRMVKSSDGDHIWLVARLDEDHVMNLAEGFLEGLEGVSGTRSIVDWHFQTGKCVLKMDRDAVFRKNPNLMRVKDLEPEDFLADDLKVLQRLFDRQNFGVALSVFLQNYISNGSSRFIGQNTRYFQKNSLYRFVDGFSSARDISSDVDLNSDPISGMEELVVRTLYEFSKTLGEPDESLLTMDRSGLAKDINGSLNHIQGMYASEEDEYIIGDEYFELPVDSDMFIGIADFSENLERVYQEWKQGVETREVEGLYSARKRDFDQRRNVEELVDRYGLDIRYDVRFVSDQEEID